MTVETGPPPRLREDPEAGAAGKALAGLGMADLTTYDADAGLAAFEAAKAAAAAGGASGIVGSIVAVTIGLGAAAGGLAWALGSGGEPRAQQPVPAAVEVVAPEAAPAVTRADPSATPQEVTAAEPVRDSADESRDASAEVGPARRRPGVPRRARKPAVGDAPTPADEIASMSAIRGALADDPKRVLELVARADREFPNGMFRQERSAYTILALARLGRMDEAKRRADEFLKRHPKGALSERVRRAIAGDDAGQGN